MICLDDLLVLRPEAIEVLASGQHRDRFETGNVLEQSQCHVVELAAGQSWPELLDDERDDSSRRHRVR